MVKPEPTVPFPPTSPSTRQNEQELAPLSPKKYRHLLPLSEIKVGFKIKLSSFSTHPIRRVGAGPTLELTSLPSRAVPIERRPYHKTRASDPSLSSPSLSRSLCLSLASLSRSLSLTGLGCCRWSGGGGSPAEEAAAEIVPYPLPDVAGGEAANLGGCRAMARWRQ